MRLTTIYGKKLDELTYQEMMTFFKEHLFFKFMASGRVGIEAGCQDVVDTFIGHFAQKGTIDQLAIGIDARNEYVRDLTLRIVDSFITMGTKGFEPIMTGTWTSIAQHNLYKAT
jgi:hypothetical protein